MRVIRLAPVAAAVLTVATAGWAGLARIGVLPSIDLGGATQWHGALMVTAIATFIAVERATVVRRTWAWAAPVLSAAGAIATIAGASTAGGILITISAAILVVVMVRGAVATPGIAVALMTAGAIAWLAAGVLLMLERPLVQVVPWWSSFLVLTIAGERHELARILRPSRGALVAFAFPVWLLILATVLTLIDLRAGAFALGVAQVGLAAWLAVRDRPLAASRSNPLARFISRATRIAYVWLAIAGLLNAVIVVPAGLFYDASLHALFVGFVLTMIVAHAPIVLPAIVGGAVIFRRFIYVPLVLLTLSVALRVVADVLGRSDGRAIGSSGIGIAVLLFGAAMVSSIRARALHGSRRARHTHQPKAGDTLEA